MACELPVVSRLQSEGRSGFSEEQFPEHSNLRSVRGSFSLIQLLSNKLLEERTHPRTHSANLRQNQVLWTELLRSNLSSYSFSRRLTQADRVTQDIPPKQPLPAYLKVFFFFKYDPAQGLYYSPCRFSFRIGAVDREYPGSFLERTPNQ